MDTIECITTRKSIRKFKAEPVPRHILTSIIETAQRSPSYKNSQPWEVLILSGAKKKAVSEVMTNLLEKESPPSPDLAAPESWPAPEAARIKDLFKKRAEATGMDLTDPAVVIKAKKANFNFYGAPHAIYLFQENSLSSWSLFDLGLFAQSLMLAAHAHGLGTVPQAFATDYAKEVKEILSIPSSKRLVLGLSIGYSDLDAPINKLQTDRIPTAECMHWLE